MHSAIAIGGCRCRASAPLARRKTGRRCAALQLLRRWTYYRNSNEGAPGTLKYFRSISLITVFGDRRHVGLPVVPGSFSSDQGNPKSDLSRARDFSGGSYSWVRLLAPFLEFSLGQNHYPEPLGNACEAAGFLFLAPLLAASLIRDAWQRRADGILIAAVLFLAFAIWYISAGIPMWLARATGWSYVVSIRAILAVGVASIAGLVRHLALPRQQFESRKRSLCISALVLALFSFGCLYAANSRLGNFARLTEVTAAAVFFATVLFLFGNGSGSHRAFCCCFRCSMRAVLPIPSGGACRDLPEAPSFIGCRIFIGAIRAAVGLSSEIYQIEIAALPNSSKRRGPTFSAAPDACPIAKCSGCWIRKIDTQRFPIVTPGSAFLSQPESPPVFELLAADDYQVRLALRSEIFESLGVRYIVLVDQKEIPSLPRFEPIGGREGLVVLRHR